MGPGHSNPCCSSVNSTEKLKDINWLWSPSQKVAPIGPASEPVLGKRKSRRQSEVQESGPQTLVYISSPVKVHMFLILPGVGPPDLHFPHVPGDVWLVLRVTGTVYAVQHHSQIWLSIQLSPLTTPCDLQPFLVSSISHLANDNNFCLISCCEDFRWNNTCKAPSRRQIPSKLWFTVFTNLHTGQRMKHWRNASHMAAMGSEPQAWVRDNPG